MKSEMGTRPDLAYDGITCHIGDDWLVSARFLTDAAFVEFAPAAFRQKY
jgi:hypothetical protein